MQAVLLLCNCPLLANTDKSVHGMPGHKMLTAIPLALELLPVIERLRQFYGPEKQRGSVSHFHACDRPMLRRTQSESCVFLKHESRGSK
jgi:hypothetical protein